MTHGMGKLCIRTDTRLGIMWSMGAWQDQCRHTLHSRRLADGVKLQHSLGNSSGCRLDFWVSFLWLGIYWFFFHLFCIHIQFRGTPKQRPLSCPPHYFVTLTYHDHARCIKDLAELCSFRPPVCACAYFIFAILFLIFVSCLCIALFILECKPGLANLSKLFLGRCAHEETTRRNKRQKRLMTDSICKMAHDWRCRPTRATTCSSLSKRACSNPIV
jgi:hypothetical protein